MPRHPQRSGGQRPGNLQAPAPRSRANRSHGRPRVFHPDRTSWSIVDTHRPSQTAPSAGPHPARQPRIVRPRGHSGPCPAPRTAPKPLQTAPVLVRKPTPRRTRPLRMGAYRSDPVPVRRSRATGRDRHLPAMYRHQPRGSYPWDPPRRSPAKGSSERQRKTLTFAYPAQRTRAAQALPLRPVNAGRIPNPDASRAWHWHGARDRAPEYDPTSFRPPG